MILKIKIYDIKKKWLGTVTFDNCNYKDFRNHFTSFTHDAPYKVEFYEVDLLNGREKLVADNLL